MLFWKTNTVTAGKESASHSSLRATQSVTVLTFVLVETIFPRTSSTSRIWIWSQILLAIIFDIPKARFKVGIMCHKLHQKWQIYGKSWNSQKSSRKILDESREVQGAFLTTQSSIKKVPIWRFDNVPKTHPSEPYEPAKSCHNPQIFCASAQYS